MSKVSELRFILLGKSVSDTSSVGNLLLGRSVFETKDPLHSVVLQCERVRGHVKGRNITIINTPHLFDQTFSHHQLTLCIKECVSLSAPGPHVIMLIVEPESFSETDKRRADHILSTLSEEAHKYTMVITTKNIEISSSVDPVEENVIQKIIAECNYRHLTFSGCTQANLVEKIEEMVKENKGSLFCEIHEDAETAIGQHQSEQIIDQPEHEVTETLEEHIQTETTGMSVQTHKKSKFKELKERGVKLVKKQHSELKQTPHLKLVLLGKENIKASGSKKPSVTEVCGHQVTLVELPALYNTTLSEQEVMRQTLHCVSACIPGVDAFFIIVPEGLPTDEVKAEIEMFKRIFSSRVYDHTIFIITQQSQKKDLDKDLQAVIKTFGARYILNSSKVNAENLFPLVKDLLTKNNNRQYTMTMYAEAQVEAQLTYKRKIHYLEEQMIELKRNSPQTQDLSKSSDTLRIVLLGKTGVGKSASGNTILGKDVFKEMPSFKSVTSVCQKETAEVNGRHITVIDTPGLFDTNIDNEEIREEIVKCISMASPGPHVFLLTLQIGRFTEEETKSVDLIEKSFGKTSNMYTIILFTRGDELKGLPFEQYIKNAGTLLDRLLSACGKRYHVLNNNDKSSNTQVLTLLDKIHSMVTVNGGSCYTNEVFQKVEGALEEEKERILKERENQIEREKEELKTKYEANMEEMRREMQKQKERQEAEERQKEEQFKQREEQIKREMTEREQNLREDFWKRREDDDLKMKEKIREINREREENRKQWVRQREEDQKWKDQEEKERRRREEEWKEHQRKEKEKFEREKEEMKNNKEEELKKLQKEYEEKAAEEDRRIRDLEKIKNAEESKKKELQYLKLSQQREREQRMREEEEKRKDQKEIWEKRIAAREEKWSLEQIRKEKQYEMERQKEKVENDLKEKERKEKEEQERRRIENKANEKIRMMEEQLKVQREEDERERKKKDEEHRKKMEENLQKQREDFRKEKEEQERKHRNEQRHLSFIRELQKNQLETLKRETEEAARKQAEDKFSAELHYKVKEAKKEGLEEGRAEVEAKRSRLGRVVDEVMNFLA